jgi:hypothetical protein
MYLWNIKSLAKQLSMNDMTEKNSMHYLLASFLLILFATYYSLWWGVVRDWLFYLELIVLTVITVIGCYKAFEANGANSGVSFVMRAICLSVPAGVRVNLFSLLFGLIIYYTGGNIFSSINFADPIRAFTIVSYIGFVGFNIYFWWLLIHGFNNIRIYEQTT